MNNISKAITDGLTTKNGVLYEKGKMVGTFNADQLAHKYGFVYAEHLIKALEGGKSE